MIISITNLYKKYGQKTALNGIKLEINNGMFGLLGPNGAGKTTLMRIMSTLIKPTSGNVKLGGYDISCKKEIRKMIGYLPQEFSFYPNFTVYEMMDYLAVLVGITGRKKRKEKVIKLLRKTNMDDFMRVKTKNLSGGMKRRLGIAQALLNEPSVLIVDEPTAGLDPEERLRFRNMLSEFSDSKIVILSTHIVGDVESTCENLAVIKEGSLLFTGKSKALLESVNGEVWTAEVSKENYNEIKNNFIIISNASFEDGLKIRMLSSKIPFEGCMHANPTIEDAYMKYVKEGF